MPLSPTESWTLMGLIVVGPFVPHVYAWLGRALRGGDE